MQFGAMRALVIALGTAAAVLLAAAPASPQVAASTLSGRLLDRTTGTPVHGGVIQLAKTNRRVLTDSLGRFAFSNVAAGEYALAATALGYRAATISAVTSRSVDILIPPEPVPLAAIVALTRPRDTRVKGATVKVFGRAELLAAGDIPIAQFVRWKAHFIARPCHVLDTLALAEWAGVDCILGTRGRYAPVRVLIDGEPMRYSEDLWAHQTWDLGRVDVTYQYTAIDYPFDRPMAVIRMYSVGYLARTAARTSHFCDRVSTTDTIAYGYLATLCRQ